MPKDGSLGTLDLRLYWAPNQGCVQRNLTSCRPPDHRIVPGPSGWQSRMLTTRLPTHTYQTIYVCAHCGSLGIFFYNSCFDHITGDNIQYDMCTYSVIFSLFSIAVITALLTNHSNGYWIGLRTIGYGYEWLWPDNADNTYTNWAPERGQYVSITGLNDVKETGLNMNRKSRKWRMM